MDFSSKVTEKNENGISILVNEIRTAQEDALIETEKRTNYIKKKLDQMDEDQLNRFEVFMRSHLSRNKVKDVLARSLGNRYLITDEMAIVASSLGKLFVGDVMELAVDIAKESKNDKVMPEDIQEAYRRMQRNSQAGRLSDSTFLFSEDSMVTTETASLVDSSLDALVDLERLEARYTQDAMDVES